MIAKGESISHVLNAVSYGLSKDRANEICRENLSGEDAQELNDEFLVVQQLNCVCQKKLLRIEISPTVADGARLTAKDWEGVARDFMRRLNLHNNRQWIAILHNDRAHKHMHIYCNRIDFDGKAYNDSYFRIKCGKIAEQIAIERGLQTAMSVREHKQRALYPIKEKIKQAHKQVAQKGISPTLYQSRMRELGVSVEFNQSKSTGRVAGMSYIVGDIKIKASQVDRALGFNKLFRVDKPIATQRLQVKANNSTQSSLARDINRLFGSGITTSQKSNDKEDEREEYEQTL